MALVVNILPSVVLMKVKVVVLECVAASKVVLVRLQGCRADHLQVLDDDQATLLVPDRSHCLFFLASSAGS